MTDIFKFMEEMEKLGIKCNVKIEIEENQGF